MSRSGRISLHNLVISLHRANYYMHSIMHVNKISFNEHAILLKSEDSFIMEGTHSLSLLEMRSGPSFYQVATAHRPFLIHILEHCSKTTRT